MADFVIDESFQNFLSKRFSGLLPKNVNSVLELHKDGATVPFIARYRKEKTGNMDEVQVRGVIDTFELWSEIVKRKSFVLSEIEKQGNLTEDISKNLNACWDLGEIEEIYRPFKKKKKTKATLAREAGLEPLAQWIWDLGHGLIDDKTTLEVKAKTYINPTSGFATYDEALRGAQHIIVEKLNNDTDLRSLVRTEYLENGFVTSQKTTKFKNHSKFEMYGEFKESVKNLMNAKASHRYLALRREWQEEELKVGIEADDQKLLASFEAKALSVENQIVKAFLKESAKISLQVHVLPSVVNELHRVLKGNADDHAIQVFSNNLKKVLMGSPFGPKVVLGVDPGIRTGCKLALLDKSGTFLSSTVLQINGESAEGEAKKLFSEVLKQVQIEAIAVGNGTGGREAETFIRKVLKDISANVPVVMVSEAGASVYSASEVAREEFPDLDLTIRGAISIGRRLQDPLAELVKIEPKSIGVGQYQHDVSQQNLKKSLFSVVESCVNQIGIDINTASESLLQYVSGIGPALAKNIIEFRKQHGLFQDRQEFLKIPRFTSKGFEQSAGFLRIKSGKVFLDETGIHPESYQAVKDMANELGLTPKQLVGEGVNKLAELRDKWVQLVGEFTFDDICNELRKPGRDPRDAFKVFSFRDDIHEIKDLKEGMICPGIVTNVTNFGAFVDIGVHQDGLVHISQLSNQFVDDPQKVVSPGTNVTVKVIGVDKDKNQIALTMKLEEKTTVRPARENNKKQFSDTNKENSKGPSHFNKKKRDASRRPNSDKKRPGKEFQGRNKGSDNRNNNQRRPVQPFNNPFAALSNIKK